MRRPQHRALSTPLAPKGPTGLHGELLALSQDSGRPLLTGRVRARWW